MHIIYEDNIIINAHNIVNNEYTVFYSYTPDAVDKQILKKSFFDLIKDAAEGRELQLLSKRGFTSRTAQIHDALVLKIKDFGVDHVAPIVYQYLKDESNTQNQLDFINNIK